MNLNSIKHIHKKRKQNLLAFGYHSVLSIIKSNFFKLKELLIEKEKFKKNEILDLVKKKKIAHRLLEKKEFLRFSFPKKNKGIVAIISSYNYFSFPMLLSLH